METLWIFPILAIVVEALTEYAKNLVTLRDKKTVLLQLSAMGLGIVICVSANANLFAVMNIDLHFPILGCVLTGVFVSRGANYMNDLLGRLHTGINNSKEEKQNG